MLHFRCSFVYLVSLFQEQQQQIRSIFFCISLWQMIKKNKLITADFSRFYFLFIHKIFTIFTFFNCFKFLLNFPNAKKGKTQHLTAFTFTNINENLIGVCGKWKKMFVYNADNGENLRGVWNRLSDLSSFPLIEL